MAVKIDNYPAGRPQSGLDKADIIFEEPVEGGITRFAAVFQCQDAALIGPVRSARNIDIGILGQLGNPLLAHVGGINPVIANINASPIVNVDIGSSQSLMIHPAGHVAPDSDYTSTAIVYGTHPTMNTPPQPLFTYSDTTPPGGTAISSVNINFSGTSNVTWKWNKATDTFLRYYNGTTPDMLANNVQNQAANVVVQYVQISYGPWLENNQGGQGGPGRPLPQRQRDGRHLPQRLRHSRHLAPLHARLAHPVRQCLRRADPDAARSDLGRAGAQHHHGDHDAVGRPSVTALSNTLAPVAPGRLAGHHRQQQAVLRGREHARVRRWPRPRRTRRRPTPRRIRLRPLHSVTSKPARSNLATSSPAAYSIWWSWFISSSERRRHTGPLGVSRQNQPPGASTRNDLPHHRVPVLLADVLNGLAAVDQVERPVLVAAEVDHGVEGELHRPELGTHRLARRPSLVDGVTLVDRQVDHHQALEGVRVAQVHEARRRACPGASRPGRGCAPPAAVPPRTRCG